MSDQAQGPSWYDVLGVEPDASTDEVRTAWRRAVDGLEPGQSRFRSLNQAAEVLLDPQRRATYDTELAKVRARAAKNSAPAAPTPRKETAAPVDEPRESTAEAAESSEPDTGATGVAGLMRPRRWVVAGLVTATAVMAVIATYLTLAVPADDEVAAATAAAQSAAVAAAGPVLSYDAKTLDADHDAAVGHMTGNYREKYEQLFEGVVRQNAPRLGTKVEAQVVSSGIVRSGDDRVEVLLFVNRPTTNKGRAEPTVYRDQVRFTMQNVDGTWLVDDVQTSAA